VRLHASVELASQKPHEAEHAFPTDDASLHSISVKQNLLRLAAVFFHFLVMYEQSTI
jgi:hypothetical protein